MELGISSSTEKKKPSTALFFFLLISLLLGQVRERRVNNASYCLVATDKPSQPFPAEPKPSRRNKHKQSNDYAHEPTPSIHPSSQSAVTSPPATNLKQANPTKRSRSEQSTQSATPKQKPPPQVSTSHTCHSYVGYLCSTEHAAIQPNQPTNPPPTKTKTKYQPTLKKLEQPSSTAP
jgi:hypothetical protein